MIPEVVGCLGQLVDGKIGRCQIGVAEAKVDDVFTGTTALDLERVDDGEDVRRK